MKAIIIVVGVVIVVTIALFAMSGHSAVTLAPVKTVGIGTPVSVKVSNPHGERRVSAFLEQGGAQYPLMDQTEPSRRIFLHRHEPDRTLSFVAGKDKAPNLKEGKARLVVEAVSNDFRGATDTASEDVDVVLAAPRVTADGDQHYINQGGMELVTMTVSGSWTDAGV